MLCREYVALYTHNAFSNERSVHLRTSELLMCRHQVVFWLIHDLRVVHEKEGTVYLSTLRRLFGQPYDPCFFGARRNAIPYSLTLRTVCVSHLHNVATGRKYERYCSLIKHGWLAEFLLRSVAEIGLCFGLFSYASSLEFGDDCLFSLLVNDREMFANMRGLFLVQITQ